MFTNLLKLLKDTTGKNRKLLLGALAVLVLVVLVVLVVTRDLSIALTISVVLAIAGAVWLAASSMWDKWQASSKQRQMFQELGGQRTFLPADAKVTAAQLHKKFEEALRTLEEKLGKGFLFRLPWFLVLGEPASGKTTSLRFSTIPWRLTDELQGIGGTVACDWWFCDEAVVLDTAGKFSTAGQDSPVIPAWHEFLKMLKRTRRGRPVDGAVLMIPTDALAAPPSQREQKLKEAAATARSLRQRLVELREKLGIVFPVYVLVSKCDKLRGFEETFALLDPDKQASLFGWANPNPLEEKFNPAWVGQALDSCLRDLEPIRQEALRRHNTPEMASAVYLFPEEMRAIRSTLKVYLEKIFEANVFEEPPPFRGLFFSSNGKDDLRKLSSLIEPSRGEDAAGSARREEEISKTVKAAGESFQGRSYFVHDVYLKKVFPEKGLAFQTRKDDRFLRIKRHAKAAGFIAAILGTALVSYLFVAATDPLRKIEDSLLVVRSNVAGKEDPLEAEAKGGEGHPLSQAYDTTFKESRSRRIAWNLLVRGLTAKVYGTLDRVAGRAFTKFLGSPDLWLAGLSDPDKTILTFPGEFQGVCTARKIYEKLAGTKRPVGETAKELAALCRDPSSMAGREVIEQLSRLPLIPESSVELKASVADIITPRLTEAYKSRTQPEKLLDLKDKEGKELLFRAFKDLLAAARGFNGKHGALGEDAGLEEVKACVDAYGELRRQIDQAPAVVQLLEVNWLQVLGALQQIESVLKECPGLLPPIDDKAVFDGLVRQAEKELKVQGVVAGGDSAGKAAYKLDIDGQEKQLLEHLLKSQASTWPAGVSEIAKKCDEVPLDEKFAEALAGGPPGEPSDLEEFFGALKNSSTEHEQTLRIPSEPRTPLEALKRAKLELLKHSVCLLAAESLAKAAKKSPKDLLDVLHNQLLDPELEKSTFAQAGDYRKALQNFGRTEAKARLEELKKKALLPLPGPPYVTHAEYENWKGKDKESFLERLHGAKGDPGKLYSQWLTDLPDYVAGGKAACDILSIVPAPGMPPNPNAQAAAEFYKGVTDCLEKDGKIKAEHDPALKDIKELLGSLDKEAPAESSVAAELQSILAILKDVERKEKTWKQRGAVSFIESQRSALFSRVRDQLRVVLAYGLVEEVEGCLGQFQREFAPKFPFNWDAPPGQDADFKAFNSFGLGRLRPRESAKEAGQPATLDEMARCAGLGLEKGPGPGFKTFVERVQEIHEFLVTPQEFSVKFRPEERALKLEAKKLDLFCNRFPAENGDFDCCPIWVAEKLETLWKRSPRPKWDFGARGPLDKKIELTLGGTGLEELTFALQLEVERLCQVDKMKGAPPCCGGVDRQGALNATVSFPASDGWALLRWIKMFEAGEASDICGADPEEGHCLSFPLKLTLPRAAGLGKGAPKPAEFPILLTFWGKDGSPRKAPEFKLVVPEKLQSPWTVQDIEAQAKTLKTLQ